ncbi:unnamed protein product [Clavelina lepadiformis]|uniref:Uncharacterized protein n=1 Tax=Clavelina lepadiformis TaxID=159417 RepID=A0ABP0GZ86_CLALP
MQKKLSNRQQQIMLLNCAGFGNLEVEEIVVVLSTFTLADDVEKAETSIVLVDGLCSDQIVCNDCDKESQEK